MTILSIPRGKPATVTERRWRTAALLGLAVFLALTVFAAVAFGGRSANGGTVGVLKATRDIRPGTTITSDELGVEQVRISRCESSRALRIRGELRVWQRGKCFEKCAVAIQVHAA